jgi:PKHD-type hydroxylase
MLLHTPEVLSAEQVTQMRAALEAAGWTGGRETEGTQGAQVKRNRQLLDAAPLRRQLGQQVQAALARHLLHHAATLPQRMLPPRFNRYSDGGQYGFHVNGAVMALPNAEGQLRSDISCTLFLNEPEAYDGGKLIVSDTCGKHEVKLPAGDLIVYPSSSLHRVAPVTRGARLASFFWVQSLIRDDRRRRLLFELDASIQTLTRPGADIAAVLQLTGVHHNLLRQWTET